MEELLISTEHTMGGTLVFEDILMKNLVNWSLFLMSWIVEDAKATHAGARSFTYSSLLIFIMLVGWMEPKDYQGMDVKAIEVCRGARYQNLW